MAKVLISIRDDLLARVDRMARKRGLTRSAYISALASRDLEEGKGAGAQPAVRRAFEQLDGLFDTNAREGDATALIREQREAR
jgi:Ribbon-helix-helix protein, copG family